MFTVNSPLRLTYSRVPSRGSTSQKRRARAMVAASGAWPLETASSEIAGISGVSAASAGRMARSAASSASVTGEASAFRVTAMSRL